MRFIHGPNQARIKLWRLSCTPSSSQYFISALLGLGVTAQPLDPYFNGTIADARARGGMSAATACYCHVRFLRLIDMVNVNFESYSPLLSSQIAHDQVSYRYPCFTP